MGEVYQFIGNYDTSLAVLQSGLDLMQSNLSHPPSVQVYTGEWAILPIKKVIRNRQSII